MIGHCRGRFASYQDHLRASGFRIVAASERKEAVRLVMALRPALGIVDLSTPENLGWEVCSTLRAIPAVRSMPLLVVTDAIGAPLRVVKTRARQLDCTPLPKRLRRDELVDFVAAVIGLSRRLDQTDRGSAPVQSIDPSLTTVGSALEEPATEDD
jgi:DNA-binding response OmpR family regulator